jgi:hypothetical protein
VYSQADFNAATAAFMIPGNFVNVKFGWNNGFGQVSINEALRQHIQQQTQEPLGEVKRIPRLVGGPCVKGKDLWGC